ncbi:hypothetical protein EYD10_12404 [Varanus komodoensis]|nr:hypothetical protein EYD10_12404 [Varanus komodoensis]
MCYIHVLYVTLWLNLYSTLITFAAGKPWVVSIVVTLVSLVAALTIRLITLRYQSKMNVNTDMRLAAANEACMKHGFLVGFTVVPDKHRSVPQLWFVHFDVGPCLHSLTDAVAEMKRNQELALKRRLDELRIVIETTILPGLEEKPESSVEESPLLSERRKSSRNAVTFQDFLHLLPEGPPEASSSCCMHPTEQMTDMSWINTFNATVDPLPSSIAKAWNRTAIQGK